MVEATCSWASVIFSHHNFLLIQLQSKDCSKQLVNQKLLKDTLHCNRILGIFLLYKQIHANQKVKCVWCTEHFVFLHISQPRSGPQTAPCKRRYSELTKHPAVTNTFLQPGDGNATAVQKYKGKMKLTRLLLSPLHQDATISLPNENQESSSCRFGGVVGSMVQIIVNYCGKIPQFKVVCLLPIQL